MNITVANKDRLRDAATYAAFFVVEDNEYMTQVAVTSGESAKKMLANSTDPTRLIFRLIEDEPVGSTEPNLDDFTTRYEFEILVDLMTNLVPDSAELGDGGEDDVKYGLLAYLAGEGIVDARDYLRPLIQAAAKRVAKENGVDFG